MVALNLVAKKSTFTNLWKNKVNLILIFSDQCMMTNETLDCWEKIQMKKKFYKPQTPP